MPNGVVTSMMVVVDFDTKNPLKVICHNMNFHNGHHTKVVADLKC